MPCVAVQSFVGHLAIECFVGVGGKKYDLVEEEVEAPTPTPAAPVRQARHLDPRSTVFFPRARP